MAVTFLASLGRNLVRVVVGIVLMVALETTAYMAEGWSPGDSLYMVVLTVFGVGYGEVHPINTAYLRVLTMTTIVFGAGGTILLSSALVQFMTLGHLQQLIGGRRVQTEIDKLSGHTIVVGFGRIGVMLAKALHDGAARFVVLEQQDERVERARTLGYLCVHADATDENALRAAGIDRARSLATVLPNDAANVFITLSARALNPDIEIIARGEVPSTEGKLVQAGANKVVLPTHIGAERIAEMILFPETSRFLRTSEKMRELERTLRGIGLEVEVIVVRDGGALTDLSIAEIEERARGRFFVLQLTRRDGEPVTSPERSLRVGAGDGVLIVGRQGGAARAMFDAPAEKRRAGRLTF